MTRTLLNVVLRWLGPNLMRFGQGMWPDRLMTTGSVVRVRVRMSAGYGPLLVRHLLPVVLSLCVMFRPVPWLFVVRLHVPLSIPLVLPLNRLWATLFGLIRFPMSTVMVLYWSVLRRLVV